MRTCLAMAGVRCNLSAFTFVFHRWPLISNTRILVYVLRKTERREETKTTSISSTVHWQNKTVTAGIGKIFILVYEEYTLIPSCNPGRARLVKGLTLDKDVVFQK